MKPTLEELMDQYASPLLRYAERLVRNPHSAQDVVQQVFITYAGLEENKRPIPSAVRSWLYRSTHHRAVDLIRSDQRRKKLHEAHAEEAGIAASEKDHQDRRQVLEALHILDEKEKQVLLLRLQQGFSYREISEISGWKEGHVGWLLHQAVRKLSEHFQKQGDSV